MISSAMPAAPQPPDEKRRLKALHSLSILDTPPEERFDRLTRLAVKVFDVPFAMISIIDEKRQWFKSQQGLDVSETTRDISFCSHGILSDQALVVPDATLDPRFSDSPLVKGRLAIRFYAGWPIRTPDGHKVGMFCVMDRRPRSFGPGEVESLRDLAMVAEDEINDVRLNEAYRELRDREAELADFIENAADLIIRAAPDGRILYANRASKAALGYDDADLEGLTMPGLIAPSERPRCAQQFGRVLRGETLRDLETVFLAKDGREIPVAGHVNCQMRDGKPHATRGIYHDIAARRQVERFRSEFFHQVNHELRNPLTLIVGALHVLLANPGELAADQRRWLEMLSRNATHLQRMIEDLLELTRSETGKLALHQQPVDLASLAAQITEDFSSAAADKRIALKHKVAHGLPAGLADPLRYRQVLGNLIDNALKFTPEGGSIKVSLGRSDAEPGFLLTSVADTGLGIAEKDLDKVFEHLYQAASNLENRRKGLGLGLTICKTLVNRQGGRIWVESSPGQGSAFHFTLPAVIQ
ncbi:MAG: PAS domain S-box protein [Elusimicrobia bacterium]|nr:PAS domain S-box protein [Elusimicrobiota bacterium]